MHTLALIEQIVAAICESFPDTCCSFGLEVLESPIQVLLRLASSKRFASPETFRIWKCTQSELKLQAGYSLPEALEAGGFSQPTGFGLKGSAGACQVLN